MSSAALARPKPITQATEPVTTGGSTRSTAFFPTDLMRKPMATLRMPVAMMPICITEMTLSGAGTPNWILWPIACAMPRYAAM
jgi:hypothetical protein